MRFVNSGPDVPERLLQVHEDGHVVFFCGAGISYPAGLPGFSGLTKELYRRLDITLNPIQQAALKSDRFDTAIGLLEDDYPGGRIAVRRELAAILTPTNTSPKATKTHEALLTLANCRNGKLRLVTTNFDCLFESLIYLHGLLPPELHDRNLDCLVVSSGDFGLA
jgi:NAD-dependent SIR2 family protein deacetylase